MSKKNTQNLNEVRRFMALANLDATLASNFITKLDEMDKSYMRDDEEALQEEEDIEAEMDMEMDMEEEPEMGDEDMDMDVEMDVEMEEAPEDEAVLTDEEADAIIALADKLRAAREGDAIEGAEDLEIEELPEEPEEESDIEVEMDEEEPLEEILNDVLGEEFTDDDAEGWIKVKSSKDIELQKLQQKAAKEQEGEGYLGSEA